MSSDTAAAAVKAAEVLGAASDILAKVVNEAKARTADARRTEGMAEVALRRAEKGQAMSSATETSEKGAAT